VTSWRVLLFLTGAVEMIVLDTHIWLWWLNQEKQLLKSAVADLISKEGQIGVSAISCFEVSWLEHHQRISLPCPCLEWFEKALSGSGITLLPVTPSVSFRAVNLPEHHRDPQDRIIIATALELQAKLISADSKFPQYNELSGRLIEV